ncbi:hypothetical protein CQ039_15885 [Brevundimonas sp. MYb52]|nr:hypothetical protein CQ039_15885 [Brevundimonas sp. MYb52]
MDKMKSSREKPVQKPVCLMVLGPHRSGTSALSGVLSHLGGDLPKTLMPAGEGNAEGYFESLRVMAFNDRLLNALGSDWKDLSPLDLGGTTAQVFESLMSEAVQVLQDEFSAARLPLLKDPRICRFVGFWSEAFSRAGYEPLYIHTHRNPLETAQSLQRRDGIPIELGLLIWLRHVLDAEAATRGRTRVFTNYKALLEDWRAQIPQMEQALGLTFHRNTGKVRQQIDDFLTDSLRHQQRAPEDVRRSAQVADVVRETFQILESWAGGAGKSSDHDALDALRSRMDGALDQVAPFVRALDAGKELASALKVVEQRAQLLQDEKLGLATELERDRKAGAERVTKIAELEQKVEVFEGETTRLTAELERDRKAGAERAAEQTAKLAELEQRAAIFAEEKSRLATELEHERKAGVEREAQQAARLTELEGALRQRGLEAEEWFEENGRLAQAHAALQAEMKKLEDEREEDLGRLQENLRTRDNQIRVLEKNVEERFEEIAKVSQILLDIQAQQEEWRRELQQSNERITILSQKNEQLKRVGFKKLMARYSRNIRHSLKMIDRPA